MNDRCVSLRYPRSLILTSVRGLMVCLLAVMLTAVSGHATASWAGQTPTEAVERTMKDMLYILTELKDVSRSTQRQWEIEQVVPQLPNWFKKCALFKQLVHTVLDPEHVLHPTEASQRMQVST